MPRKKLILVVHGVGQQVPGESVGLLAAALHEEPGTDTVAASLLIPEDRAPGETGRVRMFPCHTLRRRTPQSDQLIAEVYWADVAIASQKFLGIVLQLFQVILGLGHIVRESAEHAYKNQPTLRWLANTGVLILHGPIAAVNCLVLLLCAVAMAFELSGYEYLVREPKDRFLWPFIFGIISVIASFMLHQRTRRYLMRHFFRSLIVFSLVGMVLSWIWHIDERTDTSVRLWESSPEVSEPASTDLPASPIQGGNLPEDFTSTSLKTYVENEVCDWAGENANKCWSGLGGVFSVAAFFIHVEWMIWMVLLWGTCLLIMMHFTSRFRWFGPRRAARTPALAPVALSCMMISWLFALSCIWAVTLFLYPKFGGDRALFVSGFFPVIVHWTMLIVLGLEAVWITAYAVRRYKQKTGAGSYFDEDGQPVAPPRLILADLMAITIMMGPFLLIFVMFFPASVGFDTALQSTWIGKLIVQISGILLGEFMVAAVILGGCIYYFRDEVAVGLGIANDIINYKRIEHLAKRPEDRVYPQRERIRRRFVKVAKSMIERHDPCEVIIVAHSQGTIIALDALRKDRPGPPEKSRLFDGEVREDRVWKLITLGSPFTHLYGHYFPDNFKVPRKEDTYLSEWTNVFRIDDPIGTHIGPKAARDEDAWPREVAIPPGGHTYYWLEPEVEKVLHDVISPEIALRYSLIPHRPAAAKKT
ncbi:hypothetical protein KHP62_04945 [Rhodobacteraceae bacterium NNCM2]|nr:hypothetical protein [Coraliihabitans acroporae]